MTSKVPEDGAAASAAEPRRPAGPGPSAKGAERQARLAAALRENLQRRKAQQRGRAAAARDAAGPGAAAAGAARGGAAARPDAALDTPDG